MEPEYIYGVSTCYFLLHPEQVQNVLLFGEYHIPYIEKCGKYNPQAQEISSFVKDLPSRTGGFFDIYMEYPHPKGQHRRVIFETKSGLQYLNDLHKSCTEQKSCHNLRFHLIDPRADSFSGSLAGLYRGIDNLGRIISLLEQKELIPENIRKAVDSRVSMIIGHSHKHLKWLKELRDIARKELRHINPIFGDKVRKGLEEISKSLVDLPIKDHGELVGHIQNLAIEFIKEKDRYSLSYIDNLRNLNNDIGFYFIKLIPYLDVYTLIRLFHGYTKAPHYAVNAVIDVGDQHTENIYLMLKSFGYIDLMIDDPVKAQMSFPYKRLSLEEYYRLKTFPLGKECAKLPPFQLIRYYCGSSWKKTFIIGSTSKINYRFRGVYLDIRSFKERISSFKTIRENYQGALFMLQDKVLFPIIRMYFPKLKISFLSPDAIIISSTKRRIPDYRFIQYFDPRGNWLDRVFFIDDKVPIYSNGDFLQVIKERFPQRKIYSLP